MSLRKNALAASPPDPSRHLHPLAPPARAGVRRTAGAVQVSSPVGLYADSMRKQEGPWRSPTGVLREGGGGSTSSALLPQHAVIRNSLQGGRP